MSVSIRPGKKEDAKFIAPLVYLAIEDLADMFTGAMTRNEAIERLALLSGQKGNRFSYEYALVMEEDNNIIGVGIAYPEKIIDKLTKNTLELSKKLSWQINEKISQRLLKDKEAPKGTYYIDSIAIDKGFRGKGYATLLIEVLEKKALEMGINITSLLADINNPRAKSLYEKLGYRSIGRVLANGHNYIALIKKL